MSELHIPTGWIRTNLAALGEYVNGFPFNERYWSKAGLPIVRIAQITGTQDVVDRFAGRLPSSYRLESGDLIFSWSGTLAVVRWQGGAAWLNQHLFKVIPARAVERLYLFHILQKSVAEMDKRAHGSTMKHIKRGELSEFAVVIPEGLAEQAALARILDTLDTTMRQTEAMIEKLKLVKQGLLHDLLTRGIDANGELRPPQSQAPHLYKDSSLGWIPKSWCPVKIGEEATIQHGFAFAGNFFTSEQKGHRLLVPGNFSRHGGLDFNESNTKFFTGTYPLETLLTAGETLIVMTDLSPLTLILGRSVVLRESFPVLHNQRIGKFVFKRTSDWNKHFFVMLMNDSRIRRRVIAEATGTTVRHTSPDRIKAAVIPKPSVEEQDEIARRIDVVDIKIQSERLFFNKTKRQKSGLMDDLLTGRVRVTALL